MWNVDSSDEYDAWFLALDEESKEAVLQRVLLLRQYGPNLPRPYADRNRVSYNDVVRDSKINAGIRQGGSI